MRERKSPARKSHVGLSRNCSCRRKISNKPAELHVLCRFVYAFIFRQMLMPFCFAGIHSPFRFCSLISPTSSLYHSFHQQDSDCAEKQRNHEKTANENRILLCVPYRHSFVPRLVTSQRYGVAYLVFAVELTALDRMETAVQPSYCMVTVLYAFVYFL